MLGNGSRGAVYLAARYDHREELQRVAEVLNALGFEVTSRWLVEEHDMSNVDEATRAAYAIDDMLDVLRADFVISKTETPEAGYNKGGRHAEFGMAIASGKKCFLVGPPEHVFHYLPNVDRFNDWNALLAHLGLVIIGESA